MARRASLGTPGSFTGLPRSKRHQLAHCRHQHNGACTVRQRFTPRRPHPTYTPVSFSYKLFMGLHHGRKCNRERLSWLVKILLGVGICFTATISAFSVYTQIVASHTS